MNKKNIIILVIAIIILVGALAVFLYARSLNLKDNSNSDDVNTTVITSDEYFYDINNKKVGLDSFYEKPCAILLWKSDNSKSYDMINLFQKYYKEYKDSINFLAINVNEADIDLELVDNIKKANFSIPIYLDKDLTLADKFNYEELPLLIFMEKDGMIAKQFIEFIDDDTFQANLELLKIGK